MRILFTKSSSPLSRVIRAVTKEPVSHCAIDCSGWILHSNLYGVHVELPQTFTSHSEIVYSIDIPFDINKIMATLAKDELKFYDYGALLYLGLRYLFPFLPKKNLWQSSNMYLCTEWVTDVLASNPDSMITPYQLYLQLVSKQGESK